MRKCINNDHNIKISSEDGEIGPFVSNETL